MPKAEMEIPAGMTAEQLQSALTEYVKRRESNQVQREARNGAIKKLIAAHRTEYDGYLKEAKPTK